MTYTTDIKATVARGLGKDLEPWLVAGENATKAIKEDAGYYAAHLPEVVDRFNRWLATN